MHTKRRVYKNAKTHSVYHRCLCFIFDQTTMDETRGKLPCCQEISLIKRRVRKVIKAILLEVRRENPFFMTTLINSP